jgi:predicted nuclease of predicted toxin-antitoxin system
MRLKLDENLPSDLADNLSSRGHDVDTVADEGLSGEDDPTVLTAAIQHERLIMTLDRGFGDVRIYPPGSHPGIVVLRPVNQDPRSIDRLVDRFLDEHGLADFKRCPVIVEPGQVRVRRPIG